MGEEGCCRQKECKELRFHHGGHKGTRQWSAFY
jgi:hypothetical protein